MQICKKIISKLLIFLFLAFILVVTLGPFLWVLLGSFQTNKEIISFSLTVSKGLNFANYAKALKVSPILQYFWNSVFVTVFGVGFNLVAVGSAAYVLSRFRFKGSEVIRIIYSLGLLVPSAVLMIPLYTSVQKIGLYNSKWGLVLLYVAFGIPTTLFILFSYYKTIPREMEESSYIDGGGFVKTYFSVIMPLSKPAFATAGIMQFLTCWNEYMFALLLTTGHESRTIPIALNYFESTFSTDYGAMFAAIVLITMPSIIVYVAMQKYIEAGLVAGAVKG